MDQTSQTRSLAILSIETFRSDRSIPLTKSGEAGFKTVLSDNWYGLIAPAALPAEVETKLRNAAISTLRSAELKKQYDTQDAVPSPSTPEEFAASVKGERAYHSFAGEVEALNTPTIRRLTPSCRHQLPPIAPRHAVPALYRSRPLGDDPAPSQSRPANPAGPADPG
jgi:hypothetical protein